MSEELSKLDRAILSAILADSHRPAAITNIVNGRNIDCTQNEVVKALNKLEELDLVERYTTKTWIATSKAEEYVE